MEASAQNIIGDASVGYRHGLIAYQDPLHSASSRRRAAYGIHTQSSEDAESIADRDAALWSRESDWDQVRLLLCTAGTMTCCGRWRATAIS